MAKLNKRGCTVSAEIRGGVVASARRDFRALGTGPRIVVAPAVLRGAAAGIHRKVEA